MALLAVPPSRMHEVSCKPPCLGAPETLLTRVRPRLGSHELLQRFSTSLDVSYSDRYVIFHTFYTRGDEPRRKVAGPSEPVWQPPASPQSSSSLGPGGSQTSLGNCLVSQATLIHVAGVERLGYSLPYQLRVRRASG